jgi:hypothetical protein
VIVAALPTGSLTACNRQPSESDVVHDHTRHRQHQDPIARIGVRILAGYTEHTGTTEGREAVGGSSGSSQPGRVGARPR